MEAFAQSTLQPAGVEAATVVQLWWVMLAGSVAVMLLIIGMLAYVLFRNPARRRAVPATWIIFCGGVLLPVVSLSVLLAYSLHATASMRKPAAQPQVRLEIIGHRWWWEVRYLGEGAEYFRTANQIHLPVGATAHVRLQSQDVIHSFWVPNLAGKLDMIPGEITELKLQPTRTGVFGGQCAEFCGPQHARMALHVEVQTDEDFQEWREQQQQPALPPADDQADRGRQIFESSGCALCHTIRGTAAGGLVGPDLTHLASRRALAAGTLPANRAFLSAWILDAQHFKPDSLMPSFTGFSGEELRALVAYLEGLQ